MRAYHLESPRLDALRRVEVPQPRPEAGEVLIRLRAASLNYIDLAVATGAFPAALPLIPVADGAGDVLEIGPDVTGFAVGDRVIPHFLPDWSAGPLPLLRRMRGINTPGSLADYTVVPASSLIHIPGHLSFVEAAALPIAATTAWRAVRTGAVRPGSTVLLLGTGGVSLFALQFAKASGARVIVTSSSGEKLERAKSLGADSTINYVETPDWDLRVLELTGGRGADLVVETGGSKTFPRSLNAAASEGTVFVVGFLSGDTLETSVFPIMLKMLKVVGSNTGSVADLREAVRAIDLTKLRPMIDRVHDFEDVASAYATLARGGHFGKIAMTMEDAH